MNQVFMFIVHELVDGFHKKENNIIVKEKYSKKCMYVEHIEALEQSI